MLIGKIYSRIFRPAAADSFQAKDSKHAFGVQEGFHQKIVGGHGSKNSDRRLPQLFGYMFSQIEKLLIENQIKSRGGTSGCVTGIFDLHGQFL